MSFNQQHRISGARWALAALLLVWACCWLKPVLSPGASSDVGFSAYQQDADNAVAANGNCAKAKAPLTLSAQLLLDLGVAMLAVFLWVVVLDAVRHATWGRRPDPTPWPCRPHQFHCVYLE